MSLIEASTKEFGNTLVLLHSLGSSNYRIEWFSKMTGASVSLARLRQGKYVVIRKWATSRNMADVSSEFDRRNQALIHFLNNVDVIRAKEDRVLAAKQHCVSLFTKHEGLKPITKCHFPKPRLQGAIGKDVVIKSKLGDRDLATGVLLQLVGNQAEVQLHPDSYAEQETDSAHRQKFYAKQVYLC
ncbi:hypothetical protein KD147_12275 [Pseudoalteromonas sp. BDTF-M6]|nr:hypothetical protein [Pseudoalteromonas sp. BDTF-M6]